MNMHHLRRISKHSPMHRIRIPTWSPLTLRYVPSAIQRAPFLEYPATRHFLSRFPSPWQLSSGRFKRCMYFFS